LSHLTAIKQTHNELAADCIKRFSDTRNQCFNLNISNKDLTDLAYSGLSPHLKEKLESHIFPMLVKSCSGLWIVKTESKNLETFLEVVTSLGISVMSTW
jgi:hypothetical protein